MKTPREEKTTGIGDDSCEGEDACDKEPFFEVNRTSVDLILGS